jgi:hypothetical protein
MQIYEAFLVSFILSLLLAYFQKLKVGVSNHRSVCPLLITFEPLGGI